jgi:hypothetical protein
MTTITGHTTRATGTVLTAAIYNADHNVHVTNAQNLNNEKLEGATPPVVDGEAVVWDGTSGINLKTGGYVPADVADVLLIANNLSDVNDADTSFSNLFPAGNVAPASGDKIPILDQSDSDNPKHITYEDIAVGKQTIFIPASAMKPATTNGPVAGDIETTTNNVNFATLDFDATVDESAHFSIAMPKGWDESTITWRAFWTTEATGTTGVAWALQAAAISDNQAIDSAFGTAVVVTDDAQSAAEELLVTAESAAVTIAGTPAEGDLCFFKIFRDVSNGNDNMTEDARLIGIQIFYTTNAATDD